MIRTVHLTVLVLLILANPVYSQVNREGVVFKKTIEPAMIAYGLHNTKGKNAIQNMFFTDENSLLEFHVEPSFKGAYGFKIDSISNVDYVLTIKWVSNWEEAHEKMKEAYPVKSTKQDILDNMSGEDREAVLQYNRKQYSKRFSGVISEYIIEAKEVLVSRAFAMQLHESFAALMENHVNKGVPNISRGGYTAVFRCVVGDEVWNFSTKNPLGLFKQITNICNQVVEDGKVNGSRINEDVYVDLLNNLIEKEGSIP